MRVIWPMKSYEMWNKSKIILGCAKKKGETWVDIDKHKISYRAVPL